MGSWGGGTKNIDINTYQKWPMDTVVLKLFPGVELGSQTSGVVLQSFGTDPNGKEGRTWCRSNFFPQSTCNDFRVDFPYDFLIFHSLLHFSSSLSLPIQDYASIDEIRVASTSKPAVNRVSLLFGEHSRELISPETGLMLLQLGKRKSTKRHHICQVGELVGLDSHSHFSSIFVSTQFCCFDLRMSAPSESHNEYQ